MQANSECCNERRIDLFCYCEAVRITAKTGGGKELIKLEEEIQ